MCRLICALSLFLLLIACSSSNDSAPTTKPIERIAPRTIDPTLPPPGDARPATPDALADKTSAYAAAFEQWLAERKAGKPRPTTDQSAFDPQAYSLSITPTSATPAKDPGAKVDLPATPPARDAEPAAAGANQIASLTPAPKAPDTKITDAARPDAPAKPPLPIDEVERRLRQHLKDYPKDVVAQFDLQLLLMLRDEQVPQLNTISSLANEDREMLSAILDGLSNLRSAVKADANMLSSRKIRPMLEMADRLRAHADLRIPTVALCTKVDGFGTYEPIDPLRFSAGKANPAILYCEVENFASQLNDRQLWETKLTETVELWTETGMLVWQEKSKPVVDVSRNRRHDFFLVKKIVLPATLTINRYVLKVTVVDQQANRVAESTVGLQVVAQ